MLYPMFSVRPGKRSVSPVTMNEEAYFSMLRKHKKRRTDAYVSIVEPLFSIQVNKTKIEPIA